MFYIDHNATTRMCRRAIEAIAVAQAELFGNAFSVHSEGEAARKALEAARGSIARMIGCEAEELYFTSGGTEANNWALRGIMEARVGGWGLVTSGVEHKSLLNSIKLACFDRPVYTAGNDQDGVVDVYSVIKGLETMRKKQFAACGLVSVMLANNETGVIQPVAEIVENVKCLNENSLVHTDAVQALGKIPVNVQDLGVDLMTISAHKVGGPKGIGALYVRDGVVIDPLIVGGHQERDYRAGTQNVAGAIGFQVAASERLARLKDYQTVVSAHVQALLAALQPKLIMWVNGGEAARLPNTVSVGFSGVESDALVIMLSSAGVLVSNGSACESGSLEASHVLRAMGQTDMKARSAIRFSFSDDLVEGAVNVIADRVIEVVKRVQSVTQILV